ncbi:hypothetical protein DDE18_11205 [Nocardioides gansuensis]|uniref:DUF2029 domain-containing protein n=1 Tax=Nocardioides gansuensis TaxID=2138300 RepID=A0A2T8FB39_9ACTN|nr:glycosyltransferase 87 family protein [Nocardioides gansuensis]PVG82907.1 hypothetical protein DDE18_11205 [Nocardioides gansuensis]
MAPSVRTQCAVAAVCWLAVLLYVHARGGVLLDLDVYLAGVRRMWDGHSLYGQPPGDLPFTYPPFAALVLAPLALLPTWVAYAVWSAVSCAALVAIGRAAGLSGRRWWLVPAALALEPVWMTLHFGQVNLVLAALVIADLVHRDHRGRGIATGVAAGIKLTPLVFLAFLVVTRQWRTLRAAAAAFAATVSLPFLVVPGEAARFWTDVLPDASRIGAPWYAANQGVMGVLARLGHDETWVRPVWLVLATATALGALALSRGLWTRGDGVAAVAATGLAGLLASPVSWSHHWVWVVPLAPVLWRWRGPAVAAVWTAGFVLAPFLWLPRGHHREVAWTWEHLPGDLYVWLGLAWLALVASALRGFDAFSARTSTTEQSAPVRAAAPTSSATTRTRS